MDFDDLFKIYDKLNKQIHVKSPWTNKPSNTDISAIVLIGADHESIPQFVDLASEKGVKTRQSIAGLAQPRVSFDFPNRGIEGRGIGGLVSRSLNSLHSRLQTSRENDNGVLSSSFVESRVHDIDFHELAQWRESYKPV
jgi:hypothetical protein